MKNFRFISFFVALLFGTAAVVAQDTIAVDRTMYPDYTDKKNPDWSLMTPMYESGALARNRVASGRPDHVNNAETRYFPPVFNQDGGSCSAASRISYVFSYELAAYRDLDGSKPENYYPSHFVWLHTNSPGNQGKDAFVMHVGVPSAATYGGQTYSSLFGYQEETYNDFGWMQGYDKWYEAMHNRMLQPTNFPVSVGTEEGREAVKNWLWNHNGDDSFQAGGICGIGVASGGNWQDIPPEIYDVGGTHSNNYRRLHPNKPSITIKHAVKSMIIHPEFDRVVTAREVARLQSFPDWYVFKGPYVKFHGDFDQDRYEQIGDAIPPLLAYALAKSLVTALSQEACHE